MKRVFEGLPEGTPTNPEEGQKLQDFLAFDRDHKQHDGFLLIQKFNDARAVEVIGKIIDEIAGYKEPVKSDEKTNEATNQKADS
jgi:hypothetical protein